MLSKDTSKQYNWASIKSMKLAKIKKKNKKKSLRLNTE